MTRLINPDYKKAKKNLLKNLEEKDVLIGLTKLSGKDPDEEDENDSNIILTEEFENEQNSSSGNIKYRIISNLF